MSTRAFLVLSITATFMALSMSCHPAVHGSSAATAPDSLTGIVSITGTSFEQRLVLRSGNTTTILSATPADSASLSRLGGVEVMVVGQRDDQTFRVEYFRARSVGGSPVVDGVLRNDGGRLLLETATSRIPLGNPPTALRTLVGARVWIAGPLDSGPNSYGVIVPAR